MNKKLFFLALGAAVAAVSCEENKPVDVIDTDVDLIGDITENRTLEEGQTYTLTGGLHVKAGATLTIEPGVTIVAQDDDQVDYILIEQGAKIDARGTASAPIVMTSTRKEAGAWGGLHICGKAPVNAGTDAKSEIGDASYGGNDPHDNSGTLQYIRVEYGGYAFSEEKEANGFTFYGVGDGTTVDHLQAFGGSDDGFEWFGGTVNVKYLVSTNNTADSFDWTEGWCGKGQFMVAQQISDECDALIEADNNDNDNMAEPISHPVLSNITLIGNNSDNERGVRLRAGTQAEIYNAIVAGKARALTTETQGTEQALADGTSKLQYVYLSSGVSSDNEEGQVLYDQNDFLANDNHNAIGYSFSLTNNIIGTVDGGLDASTIDSFFENAAYVGAIPSSNNWTSGWTLTAEGGSTGEATAVELVGDITEDMTLRSGSSYTLTGGLHVKAGATLTIEPGVVVTAMDDDIVDYILIEQGAKIDARGTAENPIVMTAERKEAGAWGGLHICGKAPVNAGTDAKSEIGDASYGGNDPADNSGTLQYIRVEYGGYAFSEEKEANGFTFYGVGNGTTVDHLQAINGSDDGFEWFGGTVNVKYLVSTNNTDDSFDWTEGWCGKGQFMIAYQESGECDCLMECDNNDNDNVAEPISHPVLSNITLVGNNSTENTRGIRLRAGTEAEIYNAIVTGKPQTLTVETEATENALKAGTSKLQYIHLANNLSSKEGIYTPEMFAEADNHNAVDQKISLTDNYFGTIENGLDASSIDSFFEKVSFIGAVSGDNDWTKGWAL
ncbi:MAG TPA: hypothetical protein IAC04_00850 [Candidatus Coprenecus stercoravium]|uniref:Lipoprotein n=1 Tax=Candidatus Coprenecus stercoravium TaxID=2840735 RepID=A0A9D2K9K4_9BACT|nr:hypothetical protein [Candidatus Coprenecus stercoravium]